MNQVEATVKEPSHSAEPLTLDYSYQESIHIHPWPTVDSVESGKWEDLGERVVEAVKKRVAGRFVVSQ